MAAGVSPALADPTPISSVPYTISQPGSYCLTRNLTMTADSNGITVKADNVTIDLMGFSLKGRGGGNKDGITMTDCWNVEVRNGTVEDWGGFGIFASGSDSTGHRVINVRFNRNGLVGVRLEGDSHLVKDCTSVFNAWGIAVNFGCTVTGNIVSWNDVSGIDAVSGCLVTDNTVYNNGKGIRIAGGGNLVKGNTVRMNSETGITVDGTDNVIEENLITATLVGIRFNEAGNFYANNRAADCGTCFSGSAVDGGGNKCF